MKNASSPATAKSRRTGRVGEKITSSPPEARPLVDGDQQRKTRRVHERECGKVQRDPPDPFTGELREDPVQPADVGGVNLSCDDDECVGKARLIWT